jgi:serine/threonine protein phosphatase 1
MNLIAVIGDLHGCIGTLKKIYPRLKEKTDEIYSVGDLVDRGPDPKAVVQFCMDHEIKCVRGNHEDIILKVIGEEEDRPHISRMERLENHILNGGDITIRSYTDSTEFDVDAYRRELEQSGHLDFIKSLPFKREFDGVIISHAGIADGTDDVIWHRKVVKKLPKMQIFGHTPVPKVDYHKGWYANIDTGCVYKERGLGNLTAILLDSDTGEVVEFISEKNVGEYTDNKV